MSKLSAKQQAWLADYVEAAQGARADLEFMADNVGVTLGPVCSEASLVEAEALYWRFQRDGMPEGLGTVEDFAALICRYLGQCVVDRCGGHWTLAVERNPRNGQPCVDGFGNQPWGKIYPVEIARNLPTLRVTNPSFPGVETREVLAEQLRRAVRVAKGQRHP